MNSDVRVKIVANRPSIADAALDILLGEFIGEGISREVYECSLDNNYVIKLETTNGEGDNWAEWRIWQSIQHTTDGTKKWFAPCHWISDNGKILMQRKTKPLGTKKKLPEKIPHYFTDIKRSNFGWIGNKMVCHDYSCCLERFGDIAINTKKMLDFKKMLDEY